MLLIPKLSSKQCIPFFMLCLITFISACSKPAPIPKSQCNAVVTHAKSVLGDNAPSTYDMLKQCEVADDDARGCVMAANKPMKILKCDF